MIVSGLVKRNAGTGREGILLRITAEIQETLSKINGSAIVAEVRNGSVLACQSVLHGFPESIENHRKINDSASFATSSHGSQTGCVPME